MSSQFGRTYRLNVGSLEIDGRQPVGSETMRIAFNISRSKTREPNIAEIRVWGLSRAHREGLAKLHAVRVRLEAGYADGFGVLFDGDLRTAYTTQEGAERITTIKGGDGEVAIRSARTSRTFAAGTPIGVVIQELGKSLGVGPGNLSQFTGAELAGGSKTLRRSLTLHGASAEELARVARSAGLEYSIQNSSLQILKSGRPSSTRQGPLLRADSGLIGVPEIETVAKKEHGFAAGTRKVTGVALLRPDLIPGAPFRVESSGYNGNLVCVATEHVGDTHSEEWYVKWTGRPYSK